MSSLALFTSSNSASDGKFDYVAFYETFISKRIQLLDSGLFSGVRDWTGFFRKLSERPSRGGVFTEVYIGELIPDHLRDKSATPPRVALKVMRVLGFVDESRLRKSLMVSCLFF